MADHEKWLVAAFASCDDCEWFVEARNAEGIAAQHAEKNGHTVSGELTFAFESKPENP